MTSTNQILDLIRRNFYTGPTKNLVHQLGITEDIYALYWRIIKRDIESPYPVTIDEAAATFGMPNYAAYRMATRAGGDEKHILEHILDSILPSDIFYDIGANIGIYSCLVGSILDEGGAVVSVEPYPANIGELYANIRRNYIEATVIPKALSNSEGTISLDVIDTTGAGSPEHSISDEYTTGDVVDTIPVPVLTGDMAIDRYSLPSPNIVKMDVEGAAPDIIRGMKSLKQVRTVYVEPHDNRDEIATLLSEMGFSVSELPSPSADSRDYLIAESGSGT